MPPLELTFHARDTKEEAIVIRAVEAVNANRSPEKALSLELEPGKPGHLRAAYHDVLRVASEFRNESHPGSDLAKALIGALPTVPAVPYISTPKRELQMGSPPLLMGILNITPDSFSDGGLYLEPEVAIDKVWKLIEEGADIIDIGAESTRPGSDPLSADEELKRLLPVLARLAPESPVPISVDTYKARVAEAVLGEGANIINDISGLTFDPSLAEVVARYDVPIILMHILGRPKTMQEDPHYQWLVPDVIESLSASVSRACKAGISLEKCLIDPGLGFGKTFAHNEELIEAIPDLKRTGHHVVLGPSRKAFIRAKWGESPEALAMGTADVCCRAAALGASVLRVHDVGVVRSALEESFLGRQPGRMG